MQLSGVFTAQDASVDIYLQMIVASGTMLFDTASLRRMSDLRLLKEFEKEVKVGSESFPWTHPEDGEKTVRIVAPIVYRRLGDGTIWSAEFDLEEI